MPSTNLQPFEDIERRAALLLDELRHLNNIELLKALVDRLHEGPHVLVALGVRSLRGLMENINPATKYHEITPNAMQGRCFLVFGSMLHLLADEDQKGGYRV